MENKITKEESNIHIENQKNITTKEQNHKIKIQQTQIMIAEITVFRCVYLFITI